MLQAILIVAIALAAVVVAILVIASTRPDRFRVARTATIQAPPQAIFPLIDDFKQWPDWSPYEKLDPQMQRSISGAQSGVGAIYEWEGNGKAGAGRMEIAEASPSSKLTITLDFRRPFKVHNLARFDLVSGSRGTELTWSMEGQSSLIAKAMGLFFNIDAMVGKDFEIGLANLKALAERPAN